MQDAGRLDAALIHRDAAADEVVADLVELHAHQARQGAGVAGLDGFRRRAPEPQRLRRHARSMIIARPWPTPMHSEIAA